jgi:hypothetical protein
MVISKEQPAETVSRLEARVANLERLLADRSRLLRQLTRVVCEDDLMSFSRLSVGQPPIPRAGFGLRGWRETTSMSEGDVDQTLVELWRSLAPPRLD